MAKKTRAIANDCCMPVSVEDLERQMKDNLVGRDPRDEPSRDRPAPTRTTARPWTETDNRKPYLPTEDGSTPSLDEGISFRQSF